MLKDNMLKVKVWCIFYGVVHEEWMYGAWEEKNLRNVPQV